MLERQENSVTREMDARANRAAGLIVTPPPDIPAPLLKWLEENFPPRCYEGQGSLEEHLLYAGKVQLVTYLREAFGEQQEDDQILADALAEVELPMEPED